MSYRLTAVMCALPLALASVAAASQSTHYVITDMGVLPGDSGSAAYGVNDSGQVVGASTSSAGTSRAVLSSGGSLTDVGALAAPGSGSASAMGINDTGTIVLSIGNGPHKYGYLYGGGTSLELSTAPGCSTACRTAATPSTTAARSQVIIPSVPARPPRFFTAAEPAASSVDLENGDTAFSNTSAYGINNLGAVVGNGVADAPPTLPLSGVRRGHADGEPGASGPGTAEAINDSGVVVGSTGVGWHVPGEAFVAMVVSTAGTSGYVAVALPSLGNGTSDGAYGISNTGLVVGESAGNAFLAAESGATWTTTNLNSLVSPTSGWTLQAADAVSNNGNYIAGYGTIGGQTHGFELQPATPGDANLDGKVDVNDLTIVLAHFGQSGASWASGDFTGDGKVDVNDLTIVLAHFGQTLAASAPAMAPVPEPASLLLAAAAALGLLACARRKRK